MKPRDIFDIIARSVGLVVVVYGLTYLLSAVLVMGVLESEYERYNGVFGFIVVIVGMLVVRGVIPVANFAFPPELPKTPDDRAEHSKQKDTDEAHRA